ncbi:hypothetical protein NP233_g10450 [Leucocoprinus birnbaumii]|uniref:Uncharacterized protein n=1 Tax=Leucocoprinus birnbaumii TaxID=56174 RepID=A0AAD5YPU5_9AGAR|nr:hypothetical protein NP233_g10450 [Leucocoprinus birnbaumii]
MDINNSSFTGLPLHPTPIIAQPSDTVQGYESEDLCDNSSQGHSFADQNMLTESEHSIESESTAPKSEEENYTHSHARVICYNKAGEDPYICFIRPNDNGYFSLIETCGFGRVTRILSEKYEIYDASAGHFVGLPLTCYWKHPSKYHPFFLLKPISLPFDECLGITVYVDEIDNLFYKHLWESRTPSPISLRSPPPTTPVVLVSKKRDQSIQTKIIGAAPNSADSTAALTSKHTVSIGKRKRTASLVGTSSYTPGDEHPIGNLKQRKCPRTRMRTQRADYEFNILEGTGTKDEPWTLE